MGQSGTKNGRNGVTSKQVRMIELGNVTAGNYVEPSKAIYWDGKNENG